MTNNIKSPGHLMASESQEAMAVFCAAAMQTVNAQALNACKAIFTIARGSSDTAANVLSYEMMRELNVPVTSLPPSVFSLGGGVTATGFGAVVISQSGASDDLVSATQGLRDKGAQVIAITNQPDSPVEQAAHTTVPIGAGPEFAVPATKTVIGSIGAAMALIGSLSATYKIRLDASVQQLRDVDFTHPEHKTIQSSLLRASNVFVIGRDTGFGAAQEVALKLKECCALHAEAYSASEVLHGPLQLATNPLTVLILDTGAAETQDSLNQAQARFAAEGCNVHRISPADIALAQLTPAAAAATLLAMMYPVILNTALALGLDPDAPETLAKVTKTT